MKKIIFLASAIVIAMTSCDNSKTIDSSNNTKHELNFRTLTDKGVNSRAAITDGNNILSFTINGWWDKDGSNSIGNSNPDVGIYLFNAFNITRGESILNNWDYSPKRYWPANGDMDFYAYSPASSINFSKGLTDLGVSSTEIEYNVPLVSDNNAQEDLLIAVSKDQVGPNAVILNFQHALSRVLFNAKKTKKDVTYTISSIELLNIKRSGALDLTHSEIPTTGGFDYSGGTQPLVLWSAFSTVANYKVDTSLSPVYVEYDVYTSVIGQQNALMILPQVTELGTDYLIDTDKFYIKVAYKAFAGGIYYVGDESNDGYLYIPVEDPNAAGTPLAFEIGRQYTFNLTFGDEIGEEIGFMVDVNNWDVLAPQDL